MIMWWAIGVPAEAHCFFDDSLENIEGARARGLTAVHSDNNARRADAARRVGNLGRFFWWH